MEHSFLQRNSQTYTVKKGDSLYKIANQFGTTVDSLVQINHLSNSVLTIGQILLLEDPFPTPSHIGEDICGPEIPETSPEKYDLYTVQKGDSLYKIANQFHTDVGSLQYINDLKNQVLMIGQILKIPKVTEKIYTVKAGDSLWSIAQKYHTTPLEIQKENNLSTSFLNIGQTLLLPKETVSVPIDENTYIVQKGDSLWSIAQKFQTTPTLLMQKNKLQNSLLMIGQKLIIR